MKQKVFETVKDLWVSVQKWSLQSRWCSLDHFTVTPHSPLQCPVQRTFHIDLDIFTLFIQFIQSHGGFLEAIEPQGDGKAKQNSPAFWGSSWLSPVLQQLPGDCPAVPVPCQQPGPGHLHSPAQAPAACTHLSPKNKYKIKGGLFLLAASLPDCCWNVKVTFVTRSGVTAAIPTIPAQPTGSEQSSIYPSPCPRSSHIQHLLLLGECCSQPQQAQGESQTLLFSFQGWACEKWQQMLRFWPLPAPCLSAPHKGGFWVSVLPCQESFLSK